MWSVDWNQVHGLNNGTKVARSHRFILALLPFVIAGLFAAGNLETWRARITYPGDESYEGVALSEIVHVREHVPIYRDGAASNFDAATYGPLFYFVAGRFVDVLRPSYAPLRIVSALGMLGSAACCAFLAFWLGGRRMAAWLSPVVFLAYGMPTGHGILALSDGIAVFLSLLGFVIAYRLRDGRGVLWAAPVMLLSFYYKPQYVAGTVAVFVFLMLEKRFRDAVRFAGLIAAGGISFLCFFQFVAFKGQSFLQFFLFHQAPLLSWYWFIRSVMVFALLLLGPVVISLEWLRRHPNKLVACYLLCAVLLNVLAFSKEGGDIHYFFETVFMTAILFSALVAERVFLPGYPFELVVFLVVMLFLGQWGTVHAPQAEDVARHDAMQSLLRRSFPAHAASLCANPGEMIQAGLDVPFSGLYQLTHLARRGVESDRGVVNMIRQGKFAVVVLSVDVNKETDPYALNFALTPQMLLAIRQNYEVKYVLAMPTPLKLRRQDRFFVYVPSGPVRGWREDSPSGVTN